MVTDEATRAEIKKYCKEEGEKIYNEIPEKSTVILSVFDTLEF